MTKTGDWNACSIVFFVEDLIPNTMVVRYDSQLVKLDKDSIESFHDALEQAHPEPEPELDH